LPAAGTQYANNISDKNDRTQTAQQDNTKQKRRNQITHQKEHTRNQRQHINNKNTRNLRKHTQHKQTKLENNGVCGASPIGVRILLGGADPIAPYFLL
jgi:hypothetical protein